jgi:DNA-binding NarL/FixJ family response regulator
MEEPKRPRVVLADDHPGIAGQLRALLEPEFDVVATVEDGNALVEAVARFRPDAIVTDVAMPGLDGIAAAGRIRAKNPDARIVLVSIHQDAAVVDRGLAAGALGYVAKVAAGEDLAPAVRAALRGERFLSSRVRASPG